MICRPGTVFARSWCAVLVPPSKPYSCRTDCQSVLQPPHSIAMTTNKTEIRLAAVADLHCAKTSQGCWQSLFQQAGDMADVLLLCGDLTNYGLPEEAQILVKEMSAVKIPIVAVLGNHDYESGMQTELQQPGRASEPLSRHINLPRPRSSRPSRGANEKQCARL